MDTILKTDAKTVSNPKTYFTFAICAPIQVYTNTIDNANSMKKTAVNEYSKYFPIISINLPPNYRYGNNKA